jgi:endonuclease YncB( thermonuclease family)
MTFQLARALSFTCALVLIPNVIDGPAAAREISGRARVVDGDTLVLGKEKIRLDAIDAPETDQICLDAKGRRWTCGLAARNGLAARIRGEILTCSTRGVDLHGRTLAGCRAGATDLQRWMVRMGLAQSFVAYSRHYEPEETEARRALTGLWSGAFVSPWDWRRRSEDSKILGSVKPDPSGAKILRGLEHSEGPPVQGCRVKGNVSRGGSRIYHVPGMRDYGRTRISRAAGERWFCSAREAEAAGWRRAAR